MTDMKDPTAFAQSNAWGKVWIFATFQFLFSLQMNQYFHDFTWVDVQSQTAWKVFQDKTSLDDNTSSPSIMLLAEIKFLSQSQLRILF